MPSAAHLAGYYGLRQDSSVAFVAGYVEIMRLDAVRSSCMECVEKHLGAALVLMGEAEVGYPEHKLLAIGHLHEAAEESAELRPQLSALIRDIRKAYQRGEAIAFETIVEALDQHGVWRFDRKGEGVACGRGWISRRKKCSKEKSAGTSEENRAKTVEKQKARQQLRRQVELAKGQKPYVKPSQPKSKTEEKQEPGEPPHKNPQTPQQYIENGRAIAGEFLSQARRLDDALASERRSVAAAEKRVKEEINKVWQNNLYRQVNEALAGDSQYQAIEARRQQSTEMRVTVRQKWRDKEIGSTEYFELEKKYFNAESKALKDKNKMRQAKADEIAANDPSVKFAKRSLERRQQRLEAMAQPAVELKQRLMAESQLSRSDAEAIAKKIKKPSGYKSKDPALPGQIADFMQVTNGLPSTLNRITITKQRAHATPDGLARYHGPKHHQVLWHEMAHHTEFANPDTARVAREWVKSRASGDVAPLRRLTGNAGYRSSEKAYPDEFVDPYVGKTYRAGHTEVLSMGIEAFAAPDKMVRLAAKDPEHFALILGIVRKPKD